MLTLVDVIETGIMMILLHILFFSSPTSFDGDEQVASVYSLQCE